MSQGIHAQTSSPLPTKVEGTGAISADVQLSLGEAQRIAEMSGRPLSSADFLLGMLRVGGAAARLLSEKGITPGSVETVIPQVVLDACKGAEKLLQAAHEVSVGLSASQVTSLHLLLALLRETGSALDVIRLTGNDAHKLRALVMRALTGPGPKFERRAVRPKSEPLLAPTPSVSAPATAKVIRKEESSSASPAKIQNSVSSIGAEAPDFISIPAPLTPVLFREKELGRLQDLLATRSPRLIAIVGESGEGRSVLLSALSAVTPYPLLLPTGDVGGVGTLGALFQAMHSAAPSNHAIVLEGAAWLGTEGSDGPLQLLATAAVGRKWILTLSPADLRRIELNLTSLAEGLEVVRLGSLSPQELLEIVDLGVGSLLDSSGVQIEDGLAPLLLRLAPQYPTERSQPGRSMTIVEIAMARVQRQGRNKLGKTDVATVVSEAAGLPIAQLVRDDDERFSGLEDRLGHRVVGHEEARQKIANVLRRGYAGFRGRRPLASFLLLGPTGVGKTETAKAIAESLFDGQSALLRIDLSEFSEPHSIARLIGAPPGYLGHEHGGQLTEAVRRRPAQVVLLDELEKAHRDVLLLLLQVLEDGRLTDGRGHTVDFCSTVIVMTSNLGSECYRRTRTPSENTILALARSKLPLELWNRIDEVLCFAPLTEKALETIVHRIASQSSFRLQSERGIRFRIDDSVVRTILRIETERSLGARPLRRAFERFVEGPIATEIVAGRFRSGSSIDVRCTPDGRLEFSLIA